jgi:sec-independent protein translocase protein TatA
LTEGSNVGRGLIEPWHILLLVVVVALLFGWKKLPDISRSVGRSMRIFKSEVTEMKNDGKEPRPSAAAKDTVSGDLIPPQQTQPAPQQTAQAAAPQPAQGYQPAPGPQAAQDSQDPVAEQQRHENPAL